MNTQEYTSDRIRRIQSAQNTVKYACIVGVHDNTFTIFGGKYTRIWGETPLLPHPPSAAAGELEQKDAGASRNASWPTASATTLAASASTSGMQRSHRWHHVVTLPSPRLSPAPPTIAPFACDVTAGVPAGVRYLQRLK